MCWDWKIQEDQPETVQQRLLTLSPLSSERDLQIQIRTPSVSDLCAGRQVCGCQIVPLPLPQSLLFWSQARAYRNILTNFPSIRERYVSSCWASTNFYGVLFTFGIRSRVGFPAVWLEIPKLPLSHSCSPYSDTHTLWRPPTCLQTFCQSCFSLLYSILQLPTLSYFPQYSFYSSIFSLKYSRGWKTSSKAVYDLSYQSFLHPYMYIYLLTD